MIRFIFILCFAMVSSSVIADDKLPEVSSLDINTFVAQSSKIDKVFNDDHTLDFTIEIPNNFTEKSFDKLKNNVTKNKLNGEVFYAYGPAIQDVRPYVSVKSKKITRAISAEHWFKNEALNYNYTIRGFETDETGNSYEVFYVRLDDFGRTEIVRERGMLIQNRIVTVGYSIPVDLWQSDKDTQIYAVKSFKIKNDYGVSVPEGTYEYSFLDSLYFEYPKSWKFVSAVTDSINRVDVSLLTTDIHRFIYGHLDLVTISERSLNDVADKTIFPVDLPQIIKDMKAEIAESKDYETVDVIERRQYDLNFDTALSITEVYGLRKAIADTYVVERQNQVTQELWVSVIKSAKHNKQSYIIMMVIPSRDKNFYQWAVSTRAYENILKTLR